MPDDSRYGDEDRARSVLGDFWNKIYEDRQSIAAIVAGRLEAEKQNVQNLREVVNAAFDEDDSHRERFYNIVLRQEQAEPEDAHRYGNNSLNYANNNNAFYGQGAGAAVRFPAPAGVIDFALVVDHIRQPKVMLVNGVDVWLSPDRKHIVFASNPFALEGAQIRQDVQGKYLSWWLVDAIFASPKADYIGPVDAAMKPPLMPKESSSLALRHQIARMTGIPAIATDGEVVQHIVLSPDSVSIITDRYAYKYPPNSTVIVQVGQRLRRGTFPIREVRVIDPMDGDSYEPAEEMRIPRMMLHPDIATDIVLSNQTAPLQNLGVVGGKLKIAFPVQGPSAAVQKLFDLIHDRAIAGYGPTLAESFFSPGSAPQDLAFSMLPQILNPLLFFIKNVMNGRVVSIRIEKGIIPNQGLTKEDLNELKNELPPHVWLDADLQED